VNWSIDHDRYYTQTALTELSVSTIRNPFICSIYYNVWWNQLLSIPAQWLRTLREPPVTIATVTNDIASQTSDFEAIHSRINLWLYANRKQYADLIDNGVDEAYTIYHPFYVNESVFRPLEEDRGTLAESLGIPREKVMDKYLIGSFQRDSLGSDLTQPKWQKNPGMLLEILDQLDNKQCVLILAGPRRHYMIQQCEEREIPFIFIGDIHPIRKGKDDIRHNNLSSEIMNRLYNLVDVCLITSKAEGGPKAILESALCKTIAFSTPVGMAPDLLAQESLCNSVDDFVSKIYNHIQTRDAFQQMILDNHTKVSSVNSWDKWKMRIRSVIDRAEGLLV